MLDRLFNDETYSPFVLVTFGLGCLLWAVVYGIVIRDIIKKKEVAIPVAAVAANFAWEFYWGLFYKTDMGLLLQWAYFIWFFLDIYIVYAAFRYGRKQMAVEASRKYFIPSTIGVFVIWFVFLGFFIPEYDDPIGALSGWIVNVNMSALYCLQKIKQPDFGSLKVAVLKFLGTGFCSSVVFMNFYTHKTLVAVCIMFAVLDIIYIIMLLRDKNKNAGIQKVIV